MSSYHLSQRSWNALQGVHPDLIAVVRRAIAITPIDFLVLEGRRTEQRQRALVDAGASRTMRSRHLTGHAVDIAPYLNGNVAWDWPLYHTLAKSIKRAGKQLKVPLEWGGDWLSMKDGPHWQLPRGHYPGDVPWDEDENNRQVTA